MANSGDGTGWDEASPANTEPLSYADDEIRDLRKGVRIRLEKEHVLPAGSSVGGEHKEGSAKAYFVGAAPTLRPDGSTALSAADEGRLWWNSTTNELKVWDGDSWVLIDFGAITETLSDLSDLVASLQLGHVPVGAIIAWHKSLTGVPALPASYQECNGGQIVDTDSPMYLEYTPDLNTAKETWNTAGCYLRGSETSSNTLQNDKFQSHDHIVYRDNSGALTGGGHMMVRSTSPGYDAVSQTQGVTDSTTGGTQRSALETAPVSMLVVWIMRIK